MSKKIYVGNLNYDTTETQLNELFSGYGTVVSANIITDKFTDRSKGFGFVEMEDDAAAEEAISSLNGTELGGRQLKVNEAHEKKPRNRRF